MLKMFVYLNLCIFSYGPKMSETTDEAIDLTDNVKAAGSVDQEAPSGGQNKLESIEQVAETVENLADTGVEIEAEVIECTIDDPATPATSEISDISKSATNSGRVTPASQSDVASVSSSEKSTPSRKRRSADLSGRQIEFDNMSTSSGSVKVTKFPARVGIQWRKGERLEAMDFMQKWYAIPWVDPDGGGGPNPPLENHKWI